MVKRRPRQLVTTDDDLGSADCPICGAEPGQQCSEADPNDNRLAIELGRLVHLERVEAQFDAEEVKNGWREGSNDRAKL